MISQSPNCYLEDRHCVHFSGFKEDNKGNDIVYCLAFPDGIPDDIAFGENKHTTIQKGQVGEYVFEQEEE